MYIYYFLCISVSLYSQKQEQTKISAQNIIDAILLYLYFIFLVFYLRHFHFFFFSSFNPYIFLFSCDLLKTLESKQNFLTHVLLQNTRVHGKQTIEKYLFLLK